MEKEDPMEDLDSQLMGEANFIIQEGRPTYREIWRENWFGGPEEIISFNLPNDKDDVYSTQEIDSSDEEDDFLQLRDSCLKLNSSEFDIEPDPLACTLSKCVQIQPFQISANGVKNQLKMRSSKGRKGSQKKKKGTRKIRKQRKELGSETKNIPKNYGKQIIKFIKKERALTERALLSCNSKINYDKFIQELKNKKKGLNKITDLRRLWVDFEYAREFRILSGVFLRKYCFQWIFNSRIERIKFPIKYRYKIIEGVRKPYLFECLKDF